MERVRILSLDGGGVRGAYSATVLAAIGVKMRCLMNRVELIVILISGAVLLVIAKIASAAENGRPEPLLDFPPTRVWVIAGMIFLMCYLFYYLFHWQQRIQQSGYFAKIFQETIKNNENTRLSSPIKGRWADGAYLNEVFLRRSPRGEQWVAKNPEPPPPDGLLELASKLHREYAVHEIQRSMEAPRLGMPQSDGGGGNPFSAQWGEVNRRPGGARPGIY